MGDFSENKIFVTLFRFRILVILHELCLSVGQSRTIVTPFQIFSALSHQNPPPVVKTDRLLFFTPHIFSLLPSNIKLQRVYSLSELQIIWEDFSEFSVESG